MENQLHVVAVVGSLRAGSFNRSVFRAAAELFEAIEGAALRELSLAAVPLYNGDVEAVGDPPEVVALKQGVAAADALLIFTPEYNRSVPAVTKNAIDWISRPFGNGPISGTPVGIVAASPGRGDCKGCRAHASASVSANTPHLFDPTLGIAGVARKIADGVLRDEDTRAQLAAWLRDFVAHARAVTTSAAS